MRLVQVFLWQLLVSFFNLPKSTNAELKINKINGGIALVYGIAGLIGTVWVLFRLGNQFENFKKLDGGATAGVICCILTITIIAYSLVKVGLEQLRK